MVIVESGGVMSAQPQSHLYFTLEEYFALERTSERRFEYRGGEIVLMSGGSRQHGEIASNLIFNLRRRLSEGDCRVYGSDIAVVVPAAPPYRYPDVSVVCGEAQFHHTNGLDALVNPTLLIEVLSPTSEAYDRGTKFEWYKSIPSFAEYLLIAQDRPHVTQRTKQPDGNWLERAVNDPEAALRLGSIACELPLREIYEGV
ncbi:MAG: Uma2 family endonuclease, partial [Pyrinomonadaceae bacterium]